ncbi:MAG: [NiFe]-hydrogenase assembly chaperone HybE [Burkholderiales bacterium]
MTLPDPTPRLTAAFGDVLARKMRGLPFVNPALRVEAVAFAPWKHYWLGVMLTPWAMNLMLLPREQDKWRPLAVGEKRRYSFPAGQFDFISARDDAIGEFLICSLFSPMDAFADHETARETARLARDALFEVEETALDTKLAQPMSRRDLLRGGSRRGVDERRG